MMNGLLKVCQTSHENKDYSNDWEGTYKDKRLPNGTYYYVVKQGVVETVYKGTLSILGNE